MQTRYDLGTTNPVADDYDGEQFYTVADLLANDDMEGLLELAKIGDQDAVGALYERRCGRRERRAIHGTND